MRTCSSCTEYRGALRGMRRSFAALAPVGLGPLAFVAKLIGLGGSGAAGAGAAASGGGAGAAVAGGGVATATACKVAAVVCTAAIATGGAVEVNHKITASDAPAKVETATKTVKTARGQGRPGPDRRARALRAAADDVDGARPRGRRHRPGGQAQARRHGRAASAEGHEGHDRPRRPRAPRRRHGARRDAPTRRSEAGGVRAPDATAVPTPAATTSPAPLTPVGTAPQPTPAPANTAEQTDHAAHRRRRRSPGADRRAAAARRRVSPRGSARATGARR